MVVVVVVVVASVAALAKHKVTLPGNRGYAGAIIFLHGCPLLCFLVCLLRFVFAGPAALQALLLLRTTRCCYYCSQHAAAAATTTTFCRSRCIASAAMPTPSPRIFNTPTTWDGASTRSSLQDPPLVLH